MEWTFTEGETSTRPVTRIFARFVENRVIRLAGIGGKGSKSTLRTYFFLTNIVICFSFHIHGTLYICYCYFLYVLAIQIVFLICVYLFPICTYLLLMFALTLYL
jgi:hypothetical protein